MVGWNLPALIDHTVLRPDATKADVLRLCQEAKDHGFTVIFVPPCYVDEAAAAVAGTGIHVGIPIGFPLGGHSIRTKVAEAVEAVQRGATVLDMVLNISRLKSRDHDYVRTDIAEVVKSTGGVEHKVILETCYLTQQEKQTACQLVVEAGADYVKTSTGFGAAGATVDDVRLLKETVAGRAKVKASGGIRDWNTALAMLKAGADRIGTSASLKIIDEWRATIRTQL
ncbi:MAG: 2-deoxyribose-5-phosphate aldolase [Nitrospira sp. SG-bin1]|nr:MAG: 2-deoxyribose-5-phosphate aldolase [Nitrospira sp. SG-bin1]